VKDPSGLGCWVSCALRSCLGQQLQVIFAYRPCSNSPAHLRSVLAQHCRYFQAQSRNICPRLAFLEDLGSFICLHRTQGDAIILFADMNGDICHPALQQFASSCDLHELILSCRPSLQVPATFHQGNHFGTRPIDGVWALGDVHIQAVAWCTQMDSPGDHWAILGDIDLLSTIGEPRFTVL